MNISTETALERLSAGLSVLPAVKAGKRPASRGWKTWTERLPTEFEVRAWFANRPDAVCIIAGRVSGNLECLDFDNAGELFGAWKEKVDPALYAKLAVERTPSGGYHAIYRSEAEADRNLKLARGERDAKLKTLIETRGEGGLFLCAPTDGYSLVQGDFAHIPLLSADERTALLEAARSLDETPPPPAAPSAKSPAQAGTGADAAFLVRPGDDFSRRGDIRPILCARGWEFLGTKPDGNELWRRPGKTSGSHSATFDGNVFYVFSSNAAPFEGGEGYSRFQVYSLLECGGDYTRAARELLEKGFGERAPEKPVDLSGLSASLHTPSAPAQGPIPVGELVERYPKMRPVLIHGFLRRGETMNIIAPPKTGKSWLVTDLALSVATGTEWFGFPCEKGKVLIIDNELHPETSANRIPRVVEARGFPLSRIKDDIYVENQRGRLGSIEDLAHRIEVLRPFGFRLVIIDAFYRAMPKGADENDNGTVAGIYNLIDKYAAALDCAFVLIHHTSKGNQSLKSVTDVGAGAGSQSRASDTHVILRRHKEQGCVVMESVVRSFPSVKPVCLRWNWPLWNRDDSLDSAQLEGKKEEPRGANDPEPYTIAEKLREIVDERNPVSKGVFIEKVRNTYSVMEKTAKMAVEIAIASRFIVCERLRNMPRGSQATKYVTLPEEDSGVDEDGD
ncbi:MAG: AAA family ATPase [Kiritimatiellae bacterium]|nr:AAA family ATPase [Kiritimatiellia bacterium]